MRRLFFAIAPLLVLPLAHADDLPTGKGKEVTDRVCGGCHDAGVVTKYRNSKDDWQSIAEDMKARGADGSEDDFKTIVAYLPYVPNKICPKIIIGFSQMELPLFAG